MAASGGMSACFERGKKKVNPSPSPNPNHSSYFMTVNISLGRHSLLYPNPLPDACHRKYKVHLLYGARSRCELAFEAEIAALARRWSPRLRVTFVVPEARVDEGDDEGAPGAGGSAAARKDNCDMSSSSSSSNNSSSSCNNSNAAYGSGGHISKARSFQLRRSSQRRCSSSHQRQLDVCS